MGTEIGTEISSSEESSEEEGPLLSVLRRAKREALQAAGNPKTVQHEDR